MKRTFGLLFAIALAGIAAFVLFSDKPKEVVNDIRQEQIERETDQQNQEQANQPEVVTPERTMLTVPFFAQAPTANWDDPRQQDGCEEASLLMAHLWLTGQTMTVQQAEQAIIELSDWQTQKYGNYVDRSIADSAVMFEDYFNHTNYEIKRNITAQDIKKELAQGRLVIVPTNGQILANPNYTAPGPITHMLPIIGFDDSTGEFITNDPGTRNGRQFRFSYDNLMRAIYDYPTGKHEPYAPTDTVMMVVMK
jgi:hypothetical protein